MWNMAEFNVSDLVTFISDLHHITPTKDNVQGTNFNEVYEQKYVEISHKIGDPLIAFLEQEQLGTHIKETPQWKCISLSFYLVHLLENKPNKRTLLSIEQSKRLESCFRNLSIIGIACNILPPLPYYFSIPSFKSTSSTEDTLSRYDLLKYTVSKLLLLLQNLNFRPLILSSSVSQIFVGLYQLAFCPLSKPKQVENVKQDDVFNMTDEIYQALLEDQRHFQTVLHDLRKRIHPTIFIRENIVLFQSSKAPVWFLRAVGSVLTNIMLEDDGLIQITNVILEGFDNDSTKSWRCVEVCAKLITWMLRTEKYQPCICEQLFTYLKQCEFKEGSHYRAAEQIFIHCTKLLYVKNRELCQRVFIPQFSKYLIKFHDKTETFYPKEDIMKNIAMEIRLIHGCLLTNPSSDETKQLPVATIRPLVLILFRIYTPLKDVQIDNQPERDIGEVMLEYFAKCDDVFEMLDAILFNIVSEGILQFRNDIYLMPFGEKLVVNNSKQSVAYSIGDSGAILDKLFENSPDLQVKLFGFYLNCLTENDKYFGSLTNNDLLALEEDFMNSYIERKLHVYKSLCTLAENKVIQEHVKDHPDEIFHYIKNVLEKIIASGKHRTKDFESHEFQTFFTTVMILQTLMSSFMEKGLIENQNLDEVLMKISQECQNDELKTLIGDILKALNEATEEINESFFRKSEFDKALEDICDGLLPVRGHGLMTLAKLVEKKDEVTMEKKNYVLNIFQQNLKNDDSFIYLNAVRGLAALANVFTDTVLNVLCEEYADFSKKFSEEDQIIETRMKLGEVLVRVIKELGDMAPKYKALLLNTFLGGTKDEDHLIRASSLSNLGEVCRVLGYKLGPILTEVLICVQSIITTDKSPEARRAAVTVIRQLFTGVGSGTIAYFKEDILPVYRALKQIYHNDKDDVMRLQAQLALEELNENMKEFVFPNLSLHSEKKVIELK